LMVSGVERYFQITRCFCDEDLRADRQPEFTQVDIEVSFLPTETLLAMMDAMMAELFSKTIGVEIERPFMRRSYHDAMERFGTDKPDLRFSMELVDCSQLVANSSFKVFSDCVARGGQVKAINAKGCAGWSRKVMDGWNEQAQNLGAKGLAWLAIREDGVKGPI